MEHIIIRKKSEIKNAFDNLKILEPEKDNNLEVENIFRLLISYYNLYIKNELLKQKLKEEL